MNIIHLVRATTWGGGERYALDLCRKSIETGHNVIVATKGAEDIDKRFSDAGAQIKNLPLGGVFDFQSPFSLAKIIRGIEGEEVILHVHTFKDAEIAARAKVIVGNKKRVRLVCTRHLVKKGKVSPRWNFIYRNIDAFIFISNLAKDVFMEGGPVIPEEKIKVIHNSIIIPEKYSIPIPPAQSDSGNITLLYTGRISPEKGIESLIDAMALLPSNGNFQISLRIAGTGKDTYIASLQQLAEEKGVGDRISWLGFVSDIFGEIRNADICVAPSVWREPFGLTIIEFMSQARPVITTNNGAQTEIITPCKDGILIPPSDPQALAEGIKSLASDIALREGMGNEAFTTFNSKFSYNVFFNRIIKVYQLVLTK